MQILSPTESVQLVTTSALRPASPSSSSSSSVFDETADYDTQRIALNSGLKNRRKALMLKLKTRRMKLRQAEFEAETAKAEAVTAKAKAEAAQAVAEAAKAAKAATAATAAVLKLKIEAEMARYTTFHEFLDSALPQISDQTSRTPSSSRARLRRIPKKVSDWNDFRKLVKKYREDLPPGLAQSRVRKMASFESSLNHVSNNSVKTCSFRLSPFSVGQALRTPDFVSFRNFSYPLQGMNSPCVSNGDAVLEPKISAVGVVCNLVISTGKTNLTRRYDDGDSHLMDAIYQLCSFQVQFKCKYGLLSNYEFTWATLLTESGELLVSPAFSQGDAGPLSTINMMRYLICRAAEVVNHRTEWMPPQDLVSLDDVEAEQKEAQRITLAAKKNDQSDTLRTGGNEEPEVELRFLRIMVDHEDRITWQGRIEDSDGARRQVLR